MSIYKVENMPIDRRFFGLFIGRSGDGKSVSVAGFPKPVHYMDFDNRMRGVRAADFVFGGLTGITAKTYDPYCGYQEVNDDIKTFRSLFKAGQRPFETLSIASIPSLSRVFMNEANALMPGGMVPSIKDKDGKERKSALRLTGPADYKFLNQGMLEVIDLLKGLPCNVIFDCHMVDKYGPAPGEENEYAENVVVGEKLIISDKLGELLLSNFDEVYRFSRNTSGDRYYVQFHSDIAKTTYPQLKGKLDITNKCFYQEWLRLIKPALEEKK